MRKEQKQHILYVDTVAYIVGILAVVAIVVGFYKTLEKMSAPEPKTVISDTVQIGNHKPSYEYLKSTTVYMVHPLTPTEKLKLQLNKYLPFEDSDKLSAAVGTGVIVAEIGEDYYILTNKHICEKDATNCYVSPSGERKKEGLVPLTYVKSAESEDIDLELWKVSKYALPDNKPVLGLATSNIQDRAFSVGNYLGMPFIYTEGTRAGWDREYELYNLPCVFGCSGSGIFNEDGKLVALVFAGNGVPTTIPIINSFDTAKAVAVPGTEIQKFLKGIIE